MAKQKRSNPSQQPRKQANVRNVTLRDWISGARLRTLPLAVSPVLLGFASAVSAQPGEFHWVRALAALGVALCLQIGVNYANDYSDGVRGTDDVRVGPARLTGGGGVDPKRVRNLAFFFFALAAVAGLFLVVRTEQWWLLAIGVLAILAAWFYTGGKRPYGYAGLGEVFVFIFFGLVATVGTAYTQVLFVPSNAWVLGTAAGLFACAVLMVNNLRDLDQDRSAGKRTLAVLVGRGTGRIFFGVFALAPFVATIMFMLVYPLSGFALFTLLILGPAVVITSTSETPRDLILALKLTSLGSFAWAIIMAIGIIVPNITPAVVPAYLG
ncbi:1,4-dihydroxy-2-naphthoate polyprenyltransferase [Gulosibacter sediminis]|uniref:1,4-dihydroxy-2-naphthoate polyprenyltransferase n=1 Tax=Gulosibacter sediminis TaxID=1729695 RepID=UPI0018665097|nr:1,4-dihydroxy-2-naphthoate polyprenyltransferase [Gulosibacter sediminis]